MGKFWQINTELRPLIDVRNCFSISIFGIPILIFFKLDKLLGQLGIYAAWLSIIGYLQKQLCIFIFFTTRFFSVITRFHIA